MEQTAGDQKNFWLYGGKNRKCDQISGRNGFVLVEAGARKTHKDTDNFLSRRALLSG
jgi:hypothetical protein